MRIERDAKTYAAQERTAHDLLAALPYADEGPLPTTEQRIAKAYQAGVNGERARIRTIAKAAGK